MVFEAARLQVTVDADTDAAVRGLKAVDASVQKTAGGMDSGAASAGKFNTSMSGMADAISPIPLGMAGVGLAAVAMGKASIDAASDMAENMNKVDVVFGNSADSIRAFADDAATSLGLSESAALGATGTFGNLFVSMGMGQDAAASMSTDIVQLAADLGSFNNIGTAEALEKIRAGLVGETEPLRALGVNISAVAVQAKAMELGLAGAVSELTAADKAQASYALILEQTTTAQGDFARTAGGTANSMKTTQATIDDLKASIGTGLLPIVASLAQQLTTTVGAINSVIGALNGLGGAAGGATAAVSAVDDAMIFATGGSTLLIDGVKGVAGWLDTAEAEASELVPVIFNVADALAEASGKTTIFEQVIVGLREEFDRTRTSATELQKILQGLGNEATVGGESLGKFGGAASRAAEYAGEANERNTEFFHTLELGSGSAAKAAFEIDKLGEAAENAWDKQDRLTSAWGAANDAVGFWEQNLSNAEQALAILDGEMEENGSLTVEQQRQYDLLTQATGRYAGGIEDTEGAVVDAAVAQFDFIKKQDELKGLLDSNTITASEYARQMAGITAETDPAASSTYNLTAAQGDLVTAIGGVVDKVIDLLVKLGLIPAEKKTEVSAPGATLTRDQIMDVQNAINSVDTSLIIYADVDTSAFYSALEGMALMIPHSPAKEGPLAFTPDWSWLTADAQADMEPGIKRAMDSIKSYLTGLDLDWEGVFDGLSSQAERHTNEALGHVKVFATGTKATIADPASDYAAFIQRIVQLMADAAESMGEGLERAKEFADTGTAAFSTFNSALEFITNLGDQSLTLSEHHHQSIEALNHMIYKVVALMAQNAESINGEYLEAGQAFADGARAGTDAFLSGLELMTELSDGPALTLTEDHHQTLEAINHMLYKIVALMAQSAESLNGPGLEAASALSAATSDVVSAFSDVLGFLQLLSEDVDRAAIYEDTLSEKVDFLATAAVIVANTFLAAAKTWDGEVNPAVEAFSAATSDSISALSDALGFLQLIAEDVERSAIFEDELSEKVEFLETTAMIVAATFRNSATRWDGDVNPAIEDFSAATSDSISALSDALGFLQLLTEDTGTAAIYEDELAAKVAFLETTAMIVAQHFAAGAARWSADANPAILAFAEAAGDSLGLIGDAVDALETMADFPDELPEVEAIADSLVATADIVTQAVEIAARRWAELEAAGDVVPIETLGVYADNASKAVGLVGDIADAYESMSDMSKLTQKHTDIFFHNWQVILDMIPKLVEMIEPYVGDAERFHELAILIAESFAAAAETISTVTGDANETLSKAGGSMGFGGTATAALKGYEQLEEQIRAVEQAQIDAAKTKIWEQFDAGTLTLEQATEALANVGRKLDSVGDSARKASSHVSNMNRSLETMIASSFTFAGNAGVGLGLDRFAGIEAAVLAKFQAAMAVDPESFTAAYLDAIDSIQSGLQRATLAGEADTIKRYHAMFNEINKLAATLGISTGQSFGAGIDAGLQTSDALRLSATMPTPLSATVPLSLTPLSPDIVTGGGGRGTKTVLAGFSDDQIAYLADRIAAEVGNRAEQGSRVGTAAGAESGVRRAFAEVI